MGKRTQTFQDQSLIAGGRNIQKNFDEDSPFRLSPFRHGILTGCLFAGGIRPRLFRESIV
jgi:hypothetical protein